MSKIIQQQHIYFIYDFMFLYPLSYIFILFAFESVVIVLSYFTGECIPPRTISLAAATFNLLVSMAVLDLSTFQVSFISMRHMFIRDTKKDKIEIILVLGVEENNLKLIGQENY